MARMTGGEALVKQLYREGVRVVFGLPGVQLYGVVAALRDEPGIRFVVTRHEATTSYMADGYARAGATFGTALVVPGPGLLNASAGLSTAYAASSPVLMLAGQVPKAQLGKNIGVLHEVNDQLDAIAPVTKWRRRVLEVADVAGAAHEAVEQLRTGRPRPVHLEMPPDTMESEGEVELVEPSHAERPAAAGSEIDRAAGMLLAAERPVIYAGGGVHLSGCHDALAAAAEYLQAGVVQSPEGKGSIGDASDLSLGAGLWPQSALRRYLESADVILVAGMTQIGYYSRPFWPVYQPRTYLTSSYSGSLGYEYPTALGAKVACPKRPVVAICGDGGFLYNTQELATAVLHRINVVAVVFNDNAYGNVARDLDEAWGGSYAAALHNPDFMKLADAYGVVGMRAKEPTEVGALVRDAIQLDRPVLIEVPVGRMARPPFFAPLRAPAKYRRWRGTLRWYWRPQ